MKTMVTHAHMLLMTKPVVDCEISETKADSPENTKLPLSTGNFLKQTTSKHRAKSQEAGHPIIMI